jgi:hypothetical protein
VDDLFDLESEEARRHLWELQERNLTSYDAAIDAADGDDDDAVASGGMHGRPSSLAGRARDDADDDNDLDEGGVIASQGKSDFLDRVASGAVDLSTDARGDKRLGQGRAQTEAEAFAAAERQNLEEEARQLARESKGVPVVSSHMRVKEALARLKALGVTVDVDAGDVPAAATGAPIHGLRRRYESPGSDLATAAAATAAVATDTGTETESGTRVRRAAVSFALDEDGDRDDSMGSSKGVSSAQGGRAIDAADAVAVEAGSEDLESLLRGMEYLLRAGADESSPDFARELDKFMHKAAAEEAKAAVHSRRRQVRHNAAATAPEYRRKAIRASVVAPVVVPATSQQPEVDARADTGSFWSNAFRRAYAAPSSAPSAAAGVASQAARTSARKAATSGVGPERETAAGEIAHALVAWDIGPAGTMPAAVPGLAEKADAAAPSAAAATVKAAGGEAELWGDETPVPWQQGRKQREDSMLRALAEAESRLHPNRTIPEASADSPMVDNNMTTAASPAATPADSGAVAQAVFSNATDGDAVFTRFLDARRQRAASQQTSTGHVGMSVEDPVSVSSPDVIQEASAAGASSDEPMRAISAEDQETMEAAEASEEEDERFERRLGAIERGEEAPPPFYDPRADEEDEQWVRQRRRQQRRRERSGTDSSAPSEGENELPGGSVGTPASDAILSCPLCFTTVCNQCQRHTEYANQFRAVDAFGVLVDSPASVASSSLASAAVQDASNGVPDASEAGQHAGEHKGKRRRVDDGATEGSACRPVRCADCHTEIGAFDPREEIFHFFHVIAGDV